MKSYNIGNIILPDGQFGNADYLTVAKFLLSVKNFFRQFGVDNDITTHLVYKEGNPMCCRLNQENHVIVLSSKENHYGQWVFQFSHEYCHHLINGSLRGETGGLMWFEESICRVASLSCLENMVRYCATSEERHINLYTPFAATYLRDLQRPPLPEGLRQFLPSASEPLLCSQIPLVFAENLRDYLQRESNLLSTTYSNDAYCKIAYSIFPHFHNNPNLWKILQFLGDMYSRQSLSQLYSDLCSSADDTYRSSLDDLFATLQ